MKYRKSKEEYEAQLQVKDSKQKMQEQELEKAVLLSNEEKGKLEESVRAEKELLEKVSLSI